MTQTDKKIKIEEETRRRTLLNEGIMRIHEDKARKLLKALGYENADRYSPKILIERLKGMELNVKDDVRLAVKEAALKKLMITIMRSVKTGDVIELIDPAEAARNKTVETFGKRMERDASNEKTITSVNERGSEKRVVVSTEDDVLEPAQDKTFVDDQLDRVTAPPGVEKAKEIQLKYVAEEAKKAAEEDSDNIRVKRTSKMEWPDLVITEWTPPAVGTQRRAIFEILSDASEDDPISKDEVYESVKTKFPDSKSLKVTVDGFPHWLPRSFPFSVNQKNKRYWLEERREDEK